MELVSRHLAPTDPSSEPVSPRPPDRDIPRDFGVVVVNPPARVVREEVFDRPNFPALGPAYVAGYLETHGRARVRVVDAKLQRLTIPKTVDAVLTSRPRVVGLSAPTHLITVVAEIAEAIKAADPTIVVVAGGFHPTFLPERTLEEFPIFDYLVVGEGEMAFLDLVTSLQGGCVRPDIPGVWYRADGAIHRAGRGAVPRHLDDCGMPAWHLFDQAALREHCALLPIMSQRGCPFGCNFCSRPYGRTVRRRSAEHVVREIERNIEQFGISNFGICDETFTVDKKHVADICNRVIDRGLNITWQATVHANTINEQIVVLMKRAGCTAVGFGVETGDTRIMDAMGKGVSKEKIARAARTFEKVGMEYVTFFIIGHPGETLWTVLKTIRFAAQLKGSRPAFGIMVPYPGTEVWEMAIKGEGGYRRLSTNWDDYNKQVGNAVSMNTLSRRQMELLQVAGCLYFYLANGRLTAMWRVYRQQRLRVASVVRKVLGMDGPMRMRRGVPLSRSEYDGSPRT